MSLQILILTPSLQTIFSKLTYLLPDSSGSFPASSVCLGRGGGGGIAISPLHTSASAVHPVLSPTKCTASSATVSCAAPMVLSLRVLPGAVPSDSADCFPDVYVRTGVGGWCCYLVPLAHLRLLIPVVSVSPGGGGGLLTDLPHIPPTLL